MSAQRRKDIHTLEVTGRQEKFSDMEGGVKSENTRKVSLAEE